MSYPETGSAQLVYWGVGYQHCLAQGRAVVSCWLESLSNSFRIWSLCVLRLNLRALKCETISMTFLFPGLPWDRNPEIEAWQTGGWDQCSWKPRCRLELDCVLGNQRFHCKDLSGFKVLRQWVHGFLVQVCDQKGWSKSHNSTAHLLVITGILYIL